MAFRTALTCSLAAALAHLGATNSDSPAIPVEPWGPSTSPSATVQDLHREYSNIFKLGNRNAASHRWTTFLLDRAHQMTEERLTLFFSGFCAVSGSPVRPNDYNRYRLTLQKLGGGQSTGYMHYCCWPCVCDTQDFIRVDTRNVTTSDGVTKSHQFVVIGNPCDRPEQLDVPFVQPFDKRRTSISDSAREVRCLPGGVLEGATMSDHGYVIINMFFDASDASSQPDGVAPGALQIVDDPTPGRVSTAGTGSTLFQDEREFKPRCEERAAAGYNSGMGEIFRRVCSVSPITEEALRHTCVAEPEPPQQIAAPPTPAAQPSPGTRRLEVLDTDARELAMDTDATSDSLESAAAAGDSSQETEAEAGAECKDVLPNCPSLARFCYDGKHVDRFNEVDCCATCRPLKNKAQTAQPKATTQDRNRKPRK